MNGTDRLPAAVEVAAYLVATEAMTNVARHAKASRCTVTLSHNGHLDVELTDDGVGVATSPTGGMGLRSMRERTEEIGGILCIEPAHPSWHDGPRLPSTGDRVMDDPVKVLVADDQPIVRDGLVALFNSRPEVDLVAVAGDGTTWMVARRGCKMVAMPFGHAKPTVGQE